MASAPAPKYDFESLRRTVESLTGELLTVYEELALLYSLSSQIGRLTDEKQIAAVALREAIEVMEADCGWIALWDGDCLRVHETCRLGISATTVDRIDRDVLEQLLQADRRDFISHDLSHDFKLSGAGAPSRFLASALTLDGRPRGYLCLGRRHSGSVFLSPDRKLINAVALLAAVEIENVRLQHSELEKETLIKELELARTIQQSLLPRDFSCAGFLQAAGVSEPCCEIGGDFFDLIPVNDDLCMLVIADVSGKGPPAALQAAMVQGTVNAVSRTSADLPSLMSTLNHCLMTRAANDRFVTAFAATLSCNGFLHYSNGGHTLPLWIRRSGRVVELAQGGPLLGVFPEARYSQACVQMTPGDLLVLYTDGITEARDRDRNPFGMARLRDWASKESSRPPHGVKDSLVAAIRDYCVGCRQEDDRSILVVRYSGPVEKVRK
jgi:serine phosphatase RsbU (regulator of sigma subunit)